MHVDENNNENDFLMQYNIIIARCFPGTDGTPVVFWYRALDLNAIRHNDLFWNAWFFHKTIHQ